MPKNTSVVIILRAIRISAVERFFCNSADCDSMWLRLRETAIKIDSLSSISKCAIVGRKTMIQWLLMHA